MDADDDISLFKILLSLPAHFSNSGIGTRLESPPFNVIRNSIIPSSSSFPPVIPSLNIILTTPPSTWPTATTTATAATTATTAMTTVTTATRSIPSGSSPNSKTTLAIITTTKDIITILTKAITTTTISGTGLESPTAGIPSDTTTMNVAGAGLTGDTNKDAMLLIVGLTCVLIVVSALVFLVYALRTRDKGGNHDNINEKRRNSSVISPDNAPWKWRIRRPKLRIQTKTI